MRTISKQLRYYPVSCFSDVLYSFALGASLLLGQVLGQAQITRVGDVAWDFEITNRETGEPLRLSDYKGHVVVLDFFAWWCGPCRESSPDLQKNIFEYYKNRDGNKHEVPVTVIAVNTEASYPDRTDQFIKASGLKLSADDLQGVAYGQFNEEGYIPLFVIINGVAGNSDYKQWEVIYKDIGYEGSAVFRRVINKVKLGRPKDAAPKFFIHPKNVDVNDLSEIVFRGVADGWPIPEYQWYHNGIPLSGETNDRLVFGTVWPGDEGKYWVIAKNTNGETRSDVAQLTLDRKDDADLSEALDFGGASFASSSRFKWVLQTEETSDGEDALLVTGLPDWGGAVVYAELKTRLKGPGELTFKAKVEGDLQIFRAFIGESSIWDTGQVTVQDEEIDWTDYKLVIPEGRHTVSFLFLQGPKNDGLDSSLWLDEMKFKSSELPNPATKLVLAAVADGKFTLSFDAVPGRTYQLQRSKNLVEWKTDHEVKPDNVAATVEVRMDSEQTSQFFRLKSH